ncbi:MAG: ECF-type sigma factor [Rudaea sp.]|uniref:ECF-type sigma factor n=1 Tax=Rudaea sp. TaxID=2136325 RepID=UPI0039E60AD9
MGDITELLRQVAAGDGAAQEPLYRLLYPELMRLARHRLANAGSVSLDANTILHEAWLRFGNAANVSIASRRTFYAYASRTMHSVIVDYVRERGARKRGARKRGGDQIALTLSDALGEAAITEMPVSAIEQAMRALERLDERACRVVEMIYFGGMSQQDIAEVLGVSTPTVQRDWRKARIFLLDQLRRG